MTLMISFISSAGFSGLASTLDASTSGSDGGTFFPLLNFLLRLSFSRNARIFGSSLIYKLIINNPVKTISIPVMLIAIPPWVKMFWRLVVPISLCHQIKCECCEWRFYSGILPCFLAGLLSCLFSSMIKALIMRNRVLWGRIISSTYPLLAAMYGFKKFFR